MERTLFLSGPHKREIEGDKCPSTWHLDGFDEEGSCIISEVYYNKKEAMVRALQVSVEMNLHIEALYKQRKKGGYR